MALWPTTLRIGDEDLKLLVTSPQGDDLLKACLPHRPPHPRALLTLLEGVALWSGEPLYAVISAGEHRDDWLGCEAWGEELWPTESALVHFDFAIPLPRALGVRCARIAHRGLASRALGQGDRCAPLQRSRPRGTQRRSREGHAQLSAARKRAHFQTDRNSGGAGNRTLASGISQVGDAARLSSLGFEDPMAFGRTGCPPESTPVPWNRPGSWRRFWRRYRAT
jgi:hypothetical protein